MRTRLLSWLTTLAPAAFIGLFEFARHSSPLETTVPMWVGNVIVFLVVLVGAYFFSGFVFRIIDRMQHELVRRSDELAHRTAVAETLYRIGTEVSASLDLDHVITSVVAAARDLLATDTAGLCLVDEATGEVAWRLVVGAAPLRHRCLAPGECIAGHIVATGQPVRVEDALTDLAFPQRDYPLLREHGLRGIMAVPLRAGSRTLGVLMVGNQRPIRFVEDELAILTGLGTQAAIAIEKATLHRRVHSLAALEERERIAREMHDGLGQVLGYVNTKAQAVRELVAAGRADAAKAQLDQLAGAAQELYADVREAILGLRTEVGGGRGLIPALREYLDHYAAQSGLAVDLDVPQDDLHLEPAVEIQLLRIIQEALTNVRKHARASRVAVHITPNGREVRIEVADDGRGVSTAPDPSLFRAPPQFGLQTMRERAEAVGGTFRLETGQRAGTRVVVTVPAGEEARVARPAG